MAGDDSRNEASEASHDAGEEPGDEPGDPSGESAESEGVPRTIHDAFFKEVFGNPEHAASALRAVTPQAIAHCVDWSSLRPERASLSKDGFRQTHGDLLFRARWTTGADLWLQILSEHQSTIDYWMILRGLGMVHALWERHRNADPSARHLPAVLMYVLYHGAKPWSAPTSLDEVIVVPEEIRDDVRPYLPSFRFVLDDLHVASDESLAARAMEPYCKLGLVVMKHARGAELRSKLAFHAREIVSLHRRDGGDILLEKVIRYVWGVNPHLDADDLVSTLKPIIGPEAEQTMMTYAQRLRKEGIEEGVKKGIAQGQREMLLGMLRQSFGALSDEVETRIARAPVETLHRWAMRVRDAGSPEEVLQDH